MNASSLALSPQARRFVASVERPTVFDRADIERTANAASAGDDAAAQGIAVLASRVAFAAPESLPAVYDAVARGWLGEPARTSLPENTDAERLADEALRSVDLPIPPAHWERFFALLESAKSGIGAGDITARVVAFAPAFGPAYQEASRRAALRLAGVATAVARQVPPRIEIATLADAPPGSLGESFYRLIVDNKFDVEVLDRDTLGLGGLPPELAYLNGRILQMHDIWHIVAGYETTVLHEVGISAFQLAQFGHAYSAMFLASVMAVGALVAPSPAFQILVQTIAEAWLHGRVTSPFMTIAWEDEWRESLDDVRRRHGITPFKGTWPADLIEKALTAAA